jgi:thiosulfate reductase cytochrome b subunit
MSAIDGFKEWIRRETITVDHEYSGVFPAVRRGIVKRHGLGSRLTHWSLFALVALMAITGFLMWTGVYAVLNDQVWGGYYKAFGIHMWTAILVLPVGFLLFPFYHIVVDGHRPWPTTAELRQLKDVRELLAIGAAFVGLRRYISKYHDARRSFNEEEAEWVAYHPMQKLFFWIQMGLLVGVVVTGFGMFEYITTQTPWWVHWLGIFQEYVSYEVLKMGHHFLAFAWVGAVAFHAYFPLLPGNWDVLRSMVTGRIYAFLVSTNGGEEAD